MRFQCEGGNTGTELWISSRMWFDAGLLSGVRERYGPGFRDSRDSFPISPGEERWICNEQPTPTARGGCEPSNGLTIRTGSGFRWRARWEACNSDIRFDCNYPETPTSPE